MTTFAPLNEEEVCDVVRWAASQNEALAIAGSGSRAEFGYQVKTNHGISVKEISGIRDYDPRELVLTAGAGTPLREIQATLAAQGQQLAFEPPDPAALFGSAHSGTLGGVFMGNQSGPRRIHAGAARDHILGVRAVNGSGELWKSGGKVIKNVTGYDLSKLLAGSWGTLSIVTEISCKVLPMAPRTRTVSVPALDAASALRVLTCMVSSVFSPTGLAWLPTSLDTGGGGRCLIRLEGTESALAERITAMAAILETGMPHQIITDPEATSLWQAVRDASPVAHCPVVLKLSLPPALTPDIANTLTERGVKTWYLDAAGAWIWIGVENEVAADLVQTLRAQLNGHGAAVIMRGPEAIKTAAGVLTLPAPALAALTHRLKQSFDPLSLFNPGRLYPV